MNARRSLWPSIVITLIALPILYVASFGPACWITSRFGLSTKWMPVVYRPITLVFSRKEPMYSTGGGTYYLYPEGLLSSFARFGADEKWRWRRFADFDVIAGRDVRTTEWEWEWCDATKSH